MSLFSERYGYTKPSDVFIRERITPEIQNEPYVIVMIVCIRGLVNRLRYIYGNTF